MLFFPWDKISRLAQSCTSAHEPWMSNNFAVFKLVFLFIYLLRKDIKVSGAVGSADELASVFNRDSRVFRDPDHRWTQSISVQTDAIECITLLFSKALSCHKWKVIVRHEYWLIHIVEHEADIYVIHLSLYRPLSCRSDTSLSVPGSTCPRFPGWGCYSPFWRAAPLPHKYGNMDRMDPTDPNGHLPAERVNTAQKHIPAEKTDKHLQKD